ncbi:hypothetical protein ED733_001597 [Metarhizium rileyi]|uniref:Uncharacterized protein n=1 Tax=Metarhizium rileyi (strain RCEF 4871) TaxID=1649241 RepID=A0A5C6G7R6_METRR|nr:hypothetical protein ED733_001597 [Metarhizium rileyi]
MLGNLKLSGGCAGAKWDYKRILALVLAFTVGIFVFVGAGKKDKTPSMTIFPVAILGIIWNSCSFASFSRRLVLNRPKLRSIVDSVMTVLWVGCAIAMVIVWNRLSHPSGDKKAAFLDIRREITLIMVFPAL